MNHSSLEIEIHPWHPFTPSDAKILFLGTFPPPQNRWGMDFYYPNKINDFWRIIGQIFHNDYSFFLDPISKKFNKEKIIHTLNCKHIAIGDSAYKIRRLKGNASDKFLDVIVPINLAEVLKHIPQCNVIATTGQKSAEIIASITNSVIPSIGSYVITNINDTEIKIYRMPSTSRAYPLALEKKTLYYKTLFNDLKIL